MNLIFILACIVMILKIARRKADYFSVGAVCHILYNFHCAYGFVFVSSHEARKTYYYHADIDPRVYLIVLLQMAVMYAVITIYDRTPRKTKRPFFSDTFNPTSEYYIFICCCIVAWVIMLYNVMKIGISNLNLEKSYIWSQISSLYITSNWLGMAVFTYGIKNRHYRLAIAGSAPVLLHFYFGSRAYFAVLCILALLAKSEQIGRNFRKNLRIYLFGAVAVIFILAYKRVYTALKAGDLLEALKVFVNPETYAYVFRLGEPRIVLANLNYIVTNDIQLGFSDVLDRLIAMVPFLNNFVRQGQYQTVSSILRQSMQSSYGLASNIWGEFYAIGSYFCVFGMYLLWIRMLAWGNRLIQRQDWSSYFYMPLVGYLGFYIHRMDFVKTVGNAKMVAMAMILFLASSFLITKKLTISIRRRDPMR